jgi:hypothetical protein
LLLFLFYLSAACRPSKPGLVLAGPPVVSHAPDAAPVPAPTRFASTASTKATLRLNSTWAKCHEAFSVGTGDPSSEVARLAEGCREVTRMHRVAEPFTGQQGAADKPQTFKWKARKDHCYRAYGAGARGIKNLDLLIVDGAGVALGQDGSDDGAPVVLDTGAICFKEDDDAAVVVSVGDGNGAYAVEVWED